MDTGLKNQKVTSGYAGGTVSSSTDTTSTVVIDTQGFGKVGFTLHSGTRTDGSYLLKIMESDNSDGTTDATELPSYNVQETMTASNAVGKVEGTPTKRYATLRITSTSVTTGCVFKEATAHLSDPRNAPA